MNSEKATALAHQEMAKHSKLAADGWTFRFNRRVRAWGLCRYGQRTIELSLPMTLAETDEALVLNTIRHEIAHALAGPGCGHGPQWRAMATKVGCIHIAASRRGSRETREALAAIAPGKFQIVIDPTGEVVRTYHRHPGAKVVETLKNCYIRGRKSETKGQLKLVAI